MREAPLTLTKSQTRHLRMIDRGEITIASCSENMEIQFVDWMDNVTVNRKVILVLLRRQLVRFSYDNLIMTTTKLGKKLASLAKAREMLFDKPGVIVGMYASQKPPSSQYRRHRRMYN